MDPTACVRLGKTKLQVTRFGRGGAPIGGLAGEQADETARAIVQRAYELGIRTFDTAPLYGRGASERRVGAALQTLPRDTFVLSTEAPVDRMHTTRTARLRSCCAPRQEV